MTRSFNLPPGVLQSDLEPPLNDTCDCCGDVITGQVWIDTEFRALLRSVCGPATEQELGQLRREIITK